jgi:hypothetical protein
LYICLELNIEINPQIDNIMKPTLHLLVGLLLTFPLCAQIEFGTSNAMNWTRNWTNFDPNSEFYPDADTQIPNIIDTDMIMSSENVYLMSGDVYITNGAIVLIEPGTVIRCQSNVPTSLVVSKGAKLIAEGNKGYPIIFTSDKPAKSRRPGDWGGIHILGSGKVNSPSKVGFLKGEFKPQYAVYGGDLEEEETTRLSFVRIEFAGKQLNAKYRSNGLSLCAMGKKTLINNVMVSYSAGDAFDCHGGTANLSQLVSYKSKDDDFDFNLGYKGEISNVLAVRHPFISDTSGSYAIEVDGFDTKQGLTTNEDVSQLVITDATFITLSDASNYKHTNAAIHVKNLAKIELKDSKVSGFANVIKFDSSFRSYYEIAKSFKIYTSLCNVHSENVSVKYEGYNRERMNKLFKNNLFTSTYSNVSDLFVKPLDVKNPKFVLKDSKESYAMMQ